MEMATERLGRGFPLYSWKALDVARKQWVDAVKLVKEAGYARSRSYQQANGMHCKGVTLALFEFVLVSSI